MKNKKIIGGILILLLIVTIPLLAWQLGVFRGDIRQRAAGNCPAGSVRNSDGSCNYNMTPGAAVTPPPVRLGQVYYVDASGTKVGIDGATVQISGVCNWPGGAVSQCNGQNYNLTAKTRDGGYYFNEDFGELWVLAPRPMNLGYLKPTLKVLSASVTGFTLSGPEAVNCSTGAGMCHDPANVCTGTTGAYNNCNLKDKGVNYSFKGEFNFKYTATANGTTPTPTSGGGTTANPSVVAIYNFRSEKHCESATRKENWTSEDYVRGGAALFYAYSKPRGKATWPVYSFTEDVGEWGVCYKTHKNGACLNDSDLSLLGYIFPPDTNVPNTSKIYVRMEDHEDCGDHMGEWDSYASFSVPERDLRWYFGQVFKDKTKAENYCEDDSMCSSGICNSQKQCEVTVTSTPTPTDMPVCQFSFEILATATPTSTPTPTPTLTSTPTPTPTDADLTCNKTCGNNSQCPSDTYCYDGHCRNSDCPEEEDCSCPGATATPTPTTISSSGGSSTTTTTKATNTPTPTVNGTITITPTSVTQLAAGEEGTVTPAQLAEAGISLPGIAVFGGGLLMAILGILLAL